MPWPLWLIRTGRASLRRPFAAGVAFAIYCVGCCGPYLYALALLAGASGSWWAGTGLVLLFATAMGLPLVLPALSYPLAYRSAERLQVRSASLARLAGMLLVGLGTLLVLEQPALRLLDLG